MTRRRRNLLLLDADRDPVKPAVMPRRKRRRAAAAPARRAGAPR